MVASVNAQPGMLESLLVKVSVFKLNPLRHLKVSLLKLW